MCCYPAAPVVLCFAITPSNPDFTALAFGSGSTTLTLSHEPSPWPTTSTLNICKQFFAALVLKYSNAEHNNSKKYKALLVPRLAKTPSPCPDIASSQ